MNIIELRKIVTDYFRKCIKQKQLPNWWRDPLLATAEADDRFNVLPKIAAGNHMLPGELLKTCKTVVVFFIPFSAEVADGIRLGDLVGNCLK